MAVYSRRFLLGLAVGVLGVGLAGCGDAGSLAYFLMPEQRFDAKMKHLAAPKDDEKEPLVLILTWAGLEMRSEFIHADRQLAEMLGKQLRDMAETYQEKIAVVPPRKVEEFKNQNPNWRALGLADVGRKFGADYVISLEMNSMSLYENGSGGTLYRGRANLTVNLADVAKPDDTPSQNTFTCTYPGGARYATSTTEYDPIQFRTLFLAHVAKQLSFYFSRYPRNERYQMD